MLACLPPEPVFDDTGATTGTGTDTVDPGSLVSTAGPDHCGSITADEVWASDRNPHLLSCPVHVDAGTLILAPGVIVEAAEGSGLVLTSSGTGTLRVLGSEAAPVVLAPDTGAGQRGHWQGLFLGNTVDARPPELHWTTVDGGGAGDGVHRASGLFNEAPGLLVDHLQLTASAGYGFALAAEGSFSADSTDLAVSDCAASAFAEVWATGTIPDGDLTGNDIDAIDLPGGQVRASARWDANDVAYRLLNDTYVDGATGDPVTLTLGAGTVLSFADGRGLYVGKSGPAALVLEGTADEPVLFQGERTRAGSWAGVGLFAGDTGSELVGFELAHAGTPFPLEAALHLEDAAATVDRGYVHDNAECGVWLDGGTSALGSELTWADNAGGDLCVP